MNIFCNTLSVVIKTLFLQHNKKGRKKKLIEILIPEIIVTIPACNMSGFVYTAKLRGFFPVLLDLTKQHTVLIFIQLFSAPIQSNVMLR